jgi:hypothetical protein
LVARDFCVIETFATVAVEEDGFIAKDVADEFIHCWFFEFTSVLFAIAVETCGTLNLFFQEVTDIYPLVDISWESIPIDPSSPQSILSGIH